MGTGTPQLPPGEQEEGPLHWDWGEGSPRLHPPQVIPSESPATPGSAPALGVRSGDDGLQGRLRLSVNSCLVCEPTGASTFCPSQVLVF